MGLKLDTFCQSCFSHPASVFCKTHIKKQADSFLDHPMALYSSLNANRVNTVVLETRILIPLSSVP